MAATIISYVLVTKNRAAELDRKLTAVKRLIRPDDELIIVDGASTDTTKDVVRNHADIVSTFVSEPDQGSADAINKGMRLARGTFIHLLFDDDVTHPDGMARAVEIMQSHPEIDVLVCGGIKYFVSKNFSRPFYFPSGTNYGTRVEHAFKYGTCGTGFLIRRSSLAKIGFFPLDALANDVAFMAQCIHNGGIVRFARINLFDHIISDSSFSVIRRPEQVKEREVLMKRYCSPSFFIRRRLKKNPIIRWLGIFRMTALGSRFISLARGHGLRYAINQTMRVARNHKGGQQESPTPIWDGGIS